MNKIYILLPVHNRKNVTKKFIDSLSRQTYKNYHLVLIDDGSTDGTSEMTARRISEVTVLKGEGDWWWGGSLHQGYMWLKSANIEPDDFVLISNDDVIFGTDYIEKGISSLAERKGPAIILSHVYTLDGEFCESGMHVDWKSFTFSAADNENSINCAATRGIFMRAATFLKIGGFYPKMLPHYLSDYEYTIRAFNKGVSMFADPAVKLYIDVKTTGYYNSSEIDNEAFLNFLKKFFSKKYVNNPIYKINFLILACPWRYKIKNILTIIYIAFKHIFFHLRKLIKSQVDFFIKIIFPKKIS